MASKAQREPYKSITLKPVAGLLDTRSTPDMIPFGGFRNVLNWEVIQKSKMCRMSGYKRFLDGLFNNNADFHDQIEGAVKEPIIFGFEAKTSIGLNKLFLGTGTKLVALNNSTGNYRIIADGYGTASLDCPERSWWAAASQEIVVFTNGVGKPVWHVIDQPPEANGQSVALIPDLEKLKVTAVGFVIEWNGLTFYANVVADGVRQSNRVMWSDYKRPISLVPKAGVSLAGEKLFGWGEVILNAMPLGNVLLFYTNLGIWECQNAGESAVTFSKRYDADRPGLRTLAFPRTLVSNGDEHYYMGSDGIYLYSYYVPRPDRPTFIHNASGSMFEDLETSRCQVNCGGFEVDKKQIWFSWAKKGQGCPQQSLVINTEFPFASTVDEGFTCFFNYSAAKQYSLRQFMLDQCICTPAELEAAGLGFVKEGGFYAVDPFQPCDQETVPECATRPTSFYTQTGLNLDGALIEDYTKAEPDSDSLCARLGDSTPHSICADESNRNQCNAVSKFVMASTRDGCLKEADPEIYYREMLTSAAACGVYEKQGYRSVLTSGPLDLNIPESTKTLLRFITEAYPVVQAIPSQLTLRVGAAAQALDPMTADGRCVIIWSDQPPKDLICLSKKTAEEHKAANTRPDLEYNWPLFWVANFAYFELSVVSDKVVPKDTGGSCCLSRFTMWVALRP